MKAITKALCSIFLTAILLTSFPATVFAYEYGEINISDMVNTRYTDSTTISIIYENDIRRIRNSNAKTYKLKSDEEKFKEIFKALGIEFNEAQRSALLSKVSLYDIGTIQTVTKYIEIDTNGNETLLDKATALERANQAATAATQNSSHSSNSETSKNGYMKQQISVIHTPNYNGFGTTKGRYVMYGSCEWLKMPIFRKKDCISLSSTDFRWKNKGDDGISNYQLLVGYDVTTYMRNGSTETHSALEDFGESAAYLDTTKGVYFEYDLPNDAANTQQSVTFSKLVFCIIAVGRVQNWGNAEQDVGVNLRYIHIQTTLETDISFDWLADSHFVISTKATTIKKPYDFSYSWEYYSDYYA